MKLALYCICGAVWKGDGIPKIVMDQIVTEWIKTHTGGDHHPCNARTAARARAKAEKIEFKQQTNP